MKKSWKQRWSDELDLMIPELCDDVKNAPIDVVQDEVKNQIKTTSLGVWPRLKAWFLTSKRRLISCCATCAVCLLTLAIVLPLMLIDTPAPSGGNAPSSGVPAQPTSQPQVISVEINPQALFSVDEDGTVAAVVATNADADVVLSGDFCEQLKGKALTVAVREFVDESAKLGYFSLNEPDAVRITACENDLSTNSLAEVKTELQAYFQEKGAYAVVVDEILSLDKFCTRYGLDSTSFDGVIEDVQTMVSPYFQRISEGKTVEELQAEYRTLVPLEEVGHRFADFLQENVDVMRQRVVDVQAICHLSSEIIGHRDNPSGILDLDYWTLLDMQAQSNYTEAFSVLMSEMQTVLAAYETKYGESIDNVGELAFAWSACEILPIEELTAFLEGTTEQFIEQFDMVVQILEGISVDVSVFTCLYELPTSIVEYTEKMQNYIQTTYIERSSQYSMEYETPRVAISATDYDAYVGGVISKYGSLGAYWNAVK